MGGGSSARPRWNRLQPAVHSFLKAWPGVPLTASGQGQARAGLGLAQPPRSLDSQPLSLQQKAAGPGGEGAQAGPATRVDPPLAALCWGFETGL